MSTNQYQLTPNDLAQILQDVVTKMRAVGMVVQVGNLNPPAEHPKRLGLAIGGLEIAAGQISAPAPTEADHV